MTKERIAKYLLENYYTKQTSIVPTEFQIFQAYERHQDEFVIIFDNPEEKNILGCAVFLTLSDDTYLNIDRINMTDLAVLSHLVEERGPNIHFILLAADGIRTIMAGIKLVKEYYKPKTISWWNPDMTVLHKYNLN
jgi:hypothetical protein